MSTVSEQNFTLHCRLYHV